MYLYLSLSHTLYSPYDLYDGHQDTVAIPLKPLDGLYTVPFRPGVQSRVTAKKMDRFKIHHKSKVRFSAFSESKFSEIVNTRSKWYSMVHGWLALPINHPYSVWL